MFKTAYALTLLACLPCQAENSAITAYTTVAPSHVMVAAHRCGYQSNGTITHPENSLSAAEYTIGLGVQILEIDVRMTSDQGLVLMHDTTVDRTTDGSGSVSNMTLAQVTNLKVKGPGGFGTETVPTLEALMLVAKGRAMVNLDKVSINSITLRDKIMEVLIATDTVDHAIFKGSASASQVASFKAAYPGQTIHYMPLVSNLSESDMIDMLDSHSPDATEIIFSSSPTGMLSTASRAKATEKDTHIWVNSLWSSLCAGHHDAVAIAGDPDGSWGWLVDNGTTIIQTDQAPQLIEYLASRNLHPPLPTTPPDPEDTELTRFSYDFDDNSLQGWSNTREGISSDNPSHFISQTDQGRGAGHSGLYSLLHTGNGTWLDGRDVAHPTLVCSSPAFDFNENLSDAWSVSVQLLGGTGTTSATPTSRETLSASSEDGGFAGIALRRVSDGAYLLYDHRDAAGQYTAWASCGWTSQEIATAISADSPAETYQIDFIDQNHGSWGWIILDSVEIKGVVPTNDNIAAYYHGADFHDHPDAKKLTFHTSAGGDTTLRHFRAQNRSGVTGKILWSKDMISWYQSGESNGSLTISMTHTVISDSETDPQEIETSFQSSTGELPSRFFLRLLVEPNHSP